MNLAMRQVPALVLRPERESGPVNQSAEMDPKPRHAIHQQRQHSLLFDLVDHLFGARRFIRA